jgi:hypothetical protein
MANADQPQLSNEAAIKTPKEAGLRWLTPVILTTWKAKFGRIAV